MRRGENILPPDVILGHQRIANIGGPSEVSISEERIAGYREALEAHGIPLISDYIVPTDLTVKGGYEATKRLLELRDMPTSIFISGDTCAIGVFEALAENRMQVPQEMALVGFDDMKFAPFLRVPLTSVHQPLEELGATAVHVLVRILEKPADQPETIVLDAKLIIRESCGYCINHDRARVRKQLSRGETER